MRWAIIWLNPINWVTGHTPRSESPIQWQGRIKPTKSHIADLKAKFQDWHMWNSPGSEPGGYVRGVYIHQSWNLAFRTPFPVTENDIVHCVLILQGVMSWGFRLALPLTGGSDPGGLCPPFDKLSNIHSNQTKPNKVLLVSVPRTSLQETDIYIILYYATTKPTVLHTTKWTQFKLILHIKKFNSHNAERNLTSLTTRQQRYKFSSEM